jgi:hypothetical protein
MGTYLLIIGSIIIGSIIGYNFAKVRFNVKELLLKIEEASNHILSLARNSEENQAIYLKNKLTFDESILEYKFFIKDYEDKLNSINTVYIQQLDELGKSLDEKYHDNSLNLNVQAAKESLPGYKPENDLNKITEKKKEPKKLSLDEIISKINDFGIDSLTEYEKNIINKIQN